MEKEELQEIASSDEVTTAIHQEIEEADLAISDLRLGLNAVALLLTNKGIITNEEYMSIQTYLE